MRKLVLMADNDRGGCDSVQASGESTLEKALRAVEALDVPGITVVPVEPTEAMLAEMVRQGVTDRAAAYLIWKSVLRVANGDEPR